MAPFTGRSEDTTASVDYVVTQPAFTVEGNIFLFLQERNLCFYVGKIKFALLKEVHKLNVI